MSQLLRNAEEILQTALAASGTDDLQELSIVTTACGGLRLVAGGGWSLEALAAEYGAGTLYRVSRVGARVKVEGRAGPERCCLESEPRGTTARMPRDWPRYTVVSPPQLPAPIC